MKIALLHDSILPPKNYGGIERIVMALAAEYTRLGHKVVIASRRGTQITDYETCHLPESHNRIDPKKYLPLDVDFLHSHEPLFVQPSLPFLVTIHGNGHEGEKYFPNTNFLSESHCRNHHAKYFVYNGVDPERYPFNENKKDYFVFLARTTWRVKNLKTCLAWAQDLGVELRIMGGSGLSRGRIHYHGLVGEPEKLELLKNARALIYPTNWDEPCAAAPLEALACGTPVITSVNGCMPELVRPGTGVVCLDYQELLSSVTKLETITSRACRDSIENYFSLKRMAEDYLILIQKIMSEGELDQHPQFAFNKNSVKLLYKPNIKNWLSLKFLGKV
jgi:glycosyltransferase involved in cell wall biosynthesis